MHPSRSLLALLLLAPVTLADDAPATQPAPTTAPSAPGRRSPSTKPTPSEPQRLLTLAEYFIKKKAYPPARQRLEQILKDYPDDPAAKDARALLDSITKPVDGKTQWKSGIDAPKKSE